MNEARDENNNPKWSVGIADVVSIELHNQSNYSQIVYAVNNVPLSTTGNLTVTGSEGIPSLFNGSYYLTIRHRNSIETTSALPVSFAGNTISYAFDDPSKAYGYNLFALPGGGYAIFGGDVSQDGLVDSSDLIQTDNDVTAFVTGYVSTDVNGDGLIDSSDMILIDNNSSAFVSSILP